MNRRAHRVFARLAVVLTVGTSAAGVAQASPPPSGVAQQVADALAGTTRDDLVLFAPDSAAYVYFEGLAFLAEFDAFGFNTSASPVTVEGEAVVMTDDGLVFDNIQLDADGRVVDLNRNGVPLSSTVYSIGLVLDDGAGVRGTIHSVRYFDGNLQVLTLTENNGAADAYISAEEFLAADQQLLNIFVSPIGPNTVNANVDLFEAVPPTGGTLRGHLWVGNAPVLPFDVPVPAMWSLQPAVPGP